MKKILAPLLIAVLAASTAVLLDRSLFRPEADALDRQIQALEARLARSQAVRDSLDRLASRQQARLQRLAGEEVRLAEAVRTLQQHITRTNQELAQLRGNRRRYEVLSSDSVLLDLNRIVRLLHARTGAADSLSR